MNAVRLSYTTWGTPEHPSVILLHGFLGCKDDWHEVAESLADTYHVVAVDLPGHGGSVDGIPESAYTMPGCAEVIIDLLDHLGVAQADLVGYSMGGRLALFLAIHYPRKWRSVVLESASPGLATEQERAARRESDDALADRLLSIGLEPFLTEWYDRPLFENLRNSGGFRKLLERRRQNNVQGLARSLRIMGTGAQPPLWDELLQAELPVLFLAGERDSKFTSLARRMAGLCPFGRAAIIEEAGHTLHFENPIRYISEVRSFFQNRK